MRIARIHLLSALVLGDRLRDLAHLAEGGCLPDRDAQLHLSHPLRLISGVPAVVPVLVVAEQSSRVVALDDDLRVALAGQEAGDLVDEDGDVVESGRLPRDLEALLIHLQSFGELLLLEEVVCLGAVLLEPDGAELLLDALLGSPGGAIVLVKEHGAVKVGLRLLIFLLDLVALGTALQQLHLEHVVVLECAGVRVEGLNDAQRSLRHLKALVVISSLEIDHAHVGEGVLVGRVDLDGLLVRGERLGEHVARKVDVTLQLHVHRFLATLDHLGVALDPLKLLRGENAGVRLSLSEVFQRRLELADPSLGCSSLDGGTSKHLLVEVLLALSLLLVDIVQRQEDGVAFFDGGDE